MGCGTSVPKVIIPDPTPGQECKVLFKKTGTFARDQYVYQDCDKEKKWLLMDKEGSLFSNPTYVLENFVRNNPQKKNEGVCLAAAKLEVTEAKTYGFSVKEDSDESEPDSGEWGDGDATSVTVKMKWKQVVKVKFFSDRERKECVAEVKVKNYHDAERNCDQHGL
jgi:hypothetical protein